MLFRLQMVRIHVQAAGQTWAMARQHGCGEFLMKQVFLWHFVGMGSSCSLLTWSGVAKCESSGRLMSRFSFWSTPSKRAKYPLAMTNTLLQAFGSRMGIGYDIGCKFGSTISKSRLGALADELSLRLLVRAFHGHAHQRLCQLSHLTTYTKGLGLEDLEGCERFFSKSNALASSTRYATAFHRQQSIMEYLHHTDTFETFPNLSMSAFFIW